MFMTEKNITENLKKPTLHLGGEVPLEIVEKFRHQCEQRHQQKYGALSAAVKLWVELPPEIQARLLNQSLKASAFIDLVNEIVDERLRRSKKRSLKED